MGRKLIFCTEVNPQSFVLLFTKGETGASWSVRDYSVPYSVSVRHAREFPFTIAELQQRTLFSLDAPATSTSDLASWHEFTSKANETHLAGSRLVLEEQQFHKPASQYPLLDKEKLYALPKATKTGDMRRIQTSPNSEDWVTWNAFALIQRTTPDSWWEALVELARKDNALLYLPAGWAEQPVATFWQCRSAPPAYENASRQRVKQSGQEAQMRRARRSAAVEGKSEIDVSLRNQRITLFMEAKLGYDVSPTTTNDPVRNQIVRNIDCLLEECGKTTPLFWMLVRDFGTMRTYTQLMRRYRDDPRTLEAALPHRDPGALRAVAANLALICWSDLLAACCPKPMAEHLQPVWKELCRRVT